MGIQELRREYHRRVCEEIIRIEKDPAQGIEYPNFADANSKSSVQIAWGVARRIGCQPGGTSIAELKTGDLFKLATRDFIEKGFELLCHLLPGTWTSLSSDTEICRVEGYEHLRNLAKVLAKQNLAKFGLAGEHIVKPDIIVVRTPVSDAEVNRKRKLVGTQEDVARLTPLRSANREKPVPILHASISCKWTIRSDRSQNTRTEALNLIRNRKGHSPHIVAVTAEPLPTRISALALGTGDLDCVYHFALTELTKTLSEVDNQDQLDMLTTMINGRRLRDISDLPFDLAT